MNEEKLIEYYNKFNEDKRLNSRHGIVEYTISMKYILDILKNINNPKIIDVGAGTGRYSIPLFDMGYDITAVELVKHNLKYITMKNEKIKAYQGNALNLHKFNDESFDMVILFGPMYHLIDKEEKIKALQEAKRIVKKNGYILISYLSNEYAIMKHGFIDGFINEEIKNNNVDNNFHIYDNDKLYSYLRIEEIDELNEIVGLKREKIVAVDLLTDYFRNSINKLSEEDFKTYITYVYSVCERKGLIELSSHILDIVKNA